MNILVVDHVILIAKLIANVNVLHSEIKLIGNETLTTHLNTSNVRAWSPVVVNLHQSKRKERSLDERSGRPAIVKNQVINLSISSPEVLTKCFSLHLSTFITTPAFSGNVS